MLSRFWSAILFGAVAGLLALLIWVLVDNRTSLYPPIRTSVTEETKEVITSEPQEITIMVGGDVMLGRYVERQIDTFGSTWPFNLIAERLAAADLTLINLESPFSHQGATTASDSLILRGEPKGVDGLILAGVDFAALANNHIPDMGNSGLNDTKSLLQQNNILYAGASDTELEAHQPAIFERGGQRIAILSYTYGANFDKPGVVYATTDADAARADIKALKNVDIVLVMVHFGQEYAASPNQKQRDFAHALIDAGATAVLGSHPHVPQPIETYREKPIFYSLGNLVFDQAPGQNRDRSAVAKLTFVGKNLRGIQLFPYHIYGYGQPRWIDSGSERQEIFDLFGLSTGEQVF